MGKTGSGVTSCSESERKIVNVEYDEFVLEERRPVTQGKLMSITKVTDVQVDFESGTKI